MAFKRTANEQQNKSTLESTSSKSENMERDESQHPDCVFHLPTTA